MKDIKDSRIKIISLALIALMLILFVASFKLMIIDGEEYRISSDTKRIKDVYIKAPRGDILDRNGKVLATTRNSFTVELLSDELKEQNENQTNKDFKDLIKLLEEDGVNYGDDSPIEMYNFFYKNIDDYTNNRDLPEDVLIKALIDNGLVGEFLELNMDSNIKFSNASRAINVIEKRSQEEIPIRVDVDNNFKLYYKSEEIDTEEEKTPEEYLEEKLDNNKAIIGNILDHPISRKLTYEMLSEKGLVNNIELVEYSFKDDMDYILNKAELSKEFPEITLDSNAKDDFVTICKSNFDIFLSSADMDDDPEKSIIPAKDIIELLEKKTGESLGIIAEYKDGKVNLSYEEGIATTESPMDNLVRLSNEQDIISEIVTDEKYKFLAQDSNTKAGITPQISVLDWDYIFVKNKSDLLEKYKLSDKATPKEALDKIGEFYEVDNEDNFEKMRMIALHKGVESSGFRSFEPLIVAYGLKEETVSKLEEQITNSGIKVSQQPVRYYPEGTRAAHVLGYIGKISQPNEIQKYIENKGYALGDLIGKTGVEESYESTLKGKDGKKVVQVDSMGNTTDVLKETAPIKGNSVYLTLDMDLQKVAEESLSHTLEKLREGGNFNSKWGDAPLRINESKGRPHYNANSGSVVVLDVKTGEVLALANEKTYDPNLFSTGISEADWKSLFPEDESNPLADRPLLNVAMQTAVQPGSIFKLNTALAGLENGMSPETSVNCTGYIDIGDTRFGCWIYNQFGGAHGYEDAYGAIRDSCNYYFYSLALGENPNTGEELPTKLSVEDIRKYAVKLGLDKPTGIEINIPYESGGSMPSPDEKKWIIKNLLNSFLEERLEEFLKEGITLNPGKKKDIIGEIVSFIDEPELEYNELESKLDEIGLDVDKLVDDSGENIVERIKYTYINQGNWNVTDMLNIVIGQGQNAYTPLQMANYVSTISNGGYKNKVSVIKEVKSADGITSLVKNEADREKIDLNNYNNLETIKDGMLMASTFGSIEQVFGNFPIQVGIKTGTAEREGINPETGEGFDDYSWMIAFAPYDDPQIAICTLLYQSGSGSNGSAIIREIVGQYMGIEPENFYNNEESFDEESSDGYEEFDEDFEEEPVIEEVNE